MQRNNSGLRHIFLVTICIFGMATGLLSEEQTAFKTVVWAPSQLASGSPFLLTVTLGGPASALHGKWFDRELEFFQARAGNAWYTLAGVDVETEPGTYPLALEATLQDGKVLRTARDIRIGPANYKTTTLRVPEKFVAPPPEALKQIALDKEIKDHAFAHHTLSPEWSGDFLPPVHALATDSFGTRRTFNGKLASIHRGMDYRAQSGTAVMAANTGSVVLARKLYFEGNCVVIDHGQQFMTLYMHLSRIEVAEGDKVRKGQRIGLSGATGRVTGPHLHFAVHWQNAYLDPAKLLQLKLTNLP